LEIGPPFLASEQKSVPLQYFGLTLEDQRFAFIQCVP
jgi:hypothetical protein